MIIVIHDTIDKENYCYLFKKGIKNVLLLIKNDKVYTNKGYTKRINLRDWRK